MEEFKNAGKHTAFELAQINTQLNQLYALRNKNQAKDTTVGVSPEEFYNPDVTFNPNKITGGGGGAGSGEKWVDIQRSLTAEMNKTNVETTKWDDRLIDINKKYEDILSKGRSGTAINKKWLSEIWLPTMIANLEAEREKELQKMIDDGNAAEAKLQNDIVNLHLKSSHEIYNIEKSNQINIDKLKAERGEISSLDILKQERDLQLENLNYEKQSIDNQITYLSNQVGQMLNMKEGLELDSKKKKVEEEINAVKKYYIENIATKERQAQLRTYEILKETYDAIPGMAEQAYSMELLLLDEKIKKLLMIEGIEENAATLYKQKELDRLKNEAGTKGYDYEKGFEAEGRIYIESMKTAGKYGADSFLAFNDTIKDSFSSLFSDIKNHSVKPFSEYLSDCFGNLGDKFANMCSEMLTNWILTGNAMKAAGMGSNESGGLLGLFQGLLGTGGNTNTNLLGSGGTGTMWSGIELPSFGYAKGGVFSAGNVIPFAKGGIITRPTLIPMANGAALTGEAGYEAAMPLVRTSSGKLGVEASGGEKGGSTIIINNITANDAKSFDDMCKRNGASITTRVISDLQGNRVLKNLIKRTTR
jgi:phage-related minor tail protein